MWVRLEIQALPKLSFDMTRLRQPKRGYTILLNGHVTCGYLMHWMHCGTYLMQWVSWPALHGRRKRGSISNDQLLISLAGRDNSKCVGGWQSQ